MELKPGTRVAWYRHDNHLTEKQRYGTVIEHNDSLTTVRWDNRRTTEVFTRFLESEEEVREYFAQQT